MSVIEARPGCKVDLHEKFGACYQCCIYCDHDTHNCHFCGTSLTHNSYDHDGRRHWLSDCRPDLLPHQPGELCTWGYRNPSECYANHEENKFEFNEDSPMV